MYRFVNKLTWNSNWIFLKVKLGYENWKWKKKYIEKKMEIKNVNIGDHSVLRYLEIG